MHSLSLRSLFFVVGYIYYQPTSSHLPHVLHLYFFKHTDHTHVSVMIIQVGGDRNYAPLLWSALDHTFNLIQFNFGIAAWKDKRGGRREAGDRELSLRVAINDKIIFLLMMMIRGVGGGMTIYLFYYFFFSGWKISPSVAIRFGKQMAASQFFDPFRVFCLSVSLSPKKKKRRKKKEKKRRRRREIH